MVKTISDPVEEVKQEALGETSGNVEAVTLVDTLIYHASKGRVSDENAEERLIRYLTC